MTPPRRNNVPAPFAHPKNCVRPPLCFRADDGYGVGGVRHETHITIDGQKLLAELARRGLSAAELARVSGVSPTTLSGIVSRGRPVTVRSARRIAKALAETPIIAGLAELLVA